MKLLRYYKRMRKIKITPGEYYHIFNRGVEKRSIFLEIKDWTRFLFLILHLQSPIVFDNVRRNIETYFKHGYFVEPAGTKKIILQRFVELVAFAIMPNHFHLIVRESEELGVARYLQRIQEAYSKYFNIKYDHKGHLFQGTYRAAHVEDNEQLLHLSAYIHKNPRELSEWKNKEQNYPWSSYQDYVQNRWGGLLRTEVVTDQFPNPTAYKEFVKSSIAKETPGDNHHF